MNALVRMSVKGHKYVFTSLHLKRSAYFVLEIIIDARAVTPSCFYFILLMLRFDNLIV
jgi:hypothetical protein